MNGTDTRSQEDIFKEVDDISVRIIKLCDILKKIITESYWGWKEPYKGEIDARSELIDELITKLYLLIHKLEDEKLATEILTGCEILREEKDELVKNHSEWKKMIII